MKLLKDRNFNIAMLISASWHLICIFLITPVLISGSIKENSTRVSFLGSILEKVVSVSEKPPSLNKVSLMQKIERIRDIDSGELSLAQPEIASRIPTAEPDKEESVSFEDRHRAIAFKIDYKNREKPKIKFKDVTVAGEAKNRALLYKPDLSKLSLFPSCFDSNYNVSVRFKISRHGFVERPEAIVSSGSSEIDQMAIRYIRKWQFVPHSNGLERAQEGVVRVTFETL